MDEFEQFMLSLIERKKQVIAEQGERYKPRDILDLLLAANQLDEGGLSDRQLMHNLNAFFIAGHETSAAALFSILYLLAHHPLHQQRLMQEISTNCGSLPPSYHQIKEVTLHTPSLCTTFSYSFGRWIICNELSRKHFAYIPLHH